MQRTPMFIVQMGWLLILGLLAVAYFSQPTVLVLRPSLGPLPIGVIWFGALGAVLISLTGIVEHAKDWDASLALWHLSRPLVGASLAVVAVLMLKAGIVSIGTAAPDSQTSNNLLYYLVAFLVGYREETFRELIKRLVDLILTPATSKGMPTIASIAPASGAMAGGTNVIISGSGFSGTSAVTFGSSRATFHVDTDNQITAQLPTAKTAGQVTVSVVSKGGAATAMFSYV